MRIYKAAYRCGCSLDLGSDGLLYVQEDYVQQQLLATLEAEHADDPGEEADHADDSEGEEDSHSWMADSKPVVRINSCNGSLSLLLAPNDDDSFTPTLENRLQFFCNAP